MAIEAPYDPYEFDPSPEGKWHNRVYIIRRIIADAIRRHAPSLQGKLLDYGCGKKPYRSFFLNAEYIGIDIETSGFPDHHKQADLYFENNLIPLPDSSIDSVLASEVFEHVFDLDTTLRDIHRVLAPGGRLLVTCPFIWPLHEKPYDFARYTPYALKEILAKHGFDILQQETGGTPAQCVGQLFIIEVLPGIVSSLLPSGSLRSRFHYPVYRRLAGIVTWLCSPGNGPGQAESDLYLSNIVLAQKPYAAPQDIR